MSNFTKIRPVGAELFHDDGQTEITKLRDAFRNFANAPTNVYMDGLVSVEKTKQILYGAFTRAIQLATADKSVLPLWRIYTYHTVPMPLPCHAILSHLIYTVRPCLIHTYHGWYV
jgi:hypothetical protein